MYTPPPLSLWLARCGVLPQLPLTEPVLAARGGPIDGAIGEYP